MAEEHTEEDFHSIDVGNRLKKNDFHYNIQARRGNIVIYMKIHWYKDKRNVLGSFVFYHTGAAASHCPKMAALNVNNWGKCI